GDGAGGILELDVDDGDAVARLHLAGRPFEIGVDVFGPAPGVEIDGLALRLRQNLVPSRGVRLGAGGGGDKQQRRRSSEQAGKACHESSSLASAAIAPTLEAGGLSTPRRARSTPAPPHRFTSA